jgi:hypothetical protein
MMICEIVGTSVFQNLKTLVVPQAVARRNQERELGRKLERLMKKLNPKRSPIACEVAQTPGMAGAPTVPDSAIGQSSAIPASTAVGPRIVHVPSAEEQQRIAQQYAQKLKGKLIADAKRDEITVAEFIARVVEAGFTYRCDRGRDAVYARDGVEVFAFGAAHGPVSTKSRGQCSSAERPVLTPEEREALRQRNLAIAAAQRAAKQARLAAHKASRKPPVQPENKDGHKNKKKCAKKS